MSARIMGRSAELIWMRGGRTRLVGHLTGTVGLVAQNRSGTKCSGRFGST